MSFDSLLLIEREIKVETVTALQHQKKSLEVICLLQFVALVIQWANQFHEDIIIVLNVFRIIFTPDIRTLSFTCYYTEY